MTSANRLEELEAAARYHRDRLAPYRAKVHSSRPTTVVRLRELEIVGRIAAFCRVIFGAGLMPGPVRAGEAAARRGQTQPS